MACLQELSKTNTLFLDSLKFIGIIRCIDMKRLIIWNLLIFKVTNDEINHLISKFITSLFGRENVQVLVNHFSRKIAKGVIESSIQGPVFLCNKMTQIALISFFPPDY